MDLQQVESVIERLTNALKAATKFKRRLIRREDQPQTFGNCDCSAEAAAAAAAAQVAVAEAIEADNALIAAIAADMVYQDCLANC